MAKFAHADVLDGGLNVIKTGATKMALVSSYTFGDSYANVVTNTLAEVSMSSSDYALSTSGNNRVLTSAAKSALAVASASGSNLHIAFTDGAARVLWVTDETSDQLVAAGVPVDFPVLTYTNVQPT